MSRSLAWILVVVAAVAAGCALTSPYRDDGWGSDSREVPPPIGPTIRPDWQNVKDDAAAIIEEALSTAPDLGPVSLTEINETLPFGTESFQWIPAGRITRLPIGAHGDRIHQVEVFTTRPPTGQAVTIVTFDGEFGPTFRFDLSQEATDRLFDVLIPED